jgi:predicted transcriptional regulator
MMVTIQIPDELDAELQQAADRLGRTKDDLIREAVLARLEEQFAAQSDFTEEQLARMRRSIEQLDRSEVVTSEQVDKTFEDWRVRRTSR